MDKDTIVYPHLFTWEQFQRALLYTKKYYGMDAPYFYLTADAELAGRGQPITIYNRLMCEDFRKRLLFSDKSASKYMEQIPDDEGWIVIWTMMFVEWGLWCEWQKDQDSDYTLVDYYGDNPNDYYRDHMREELLETYLFCKQTPIRSRMTNEIILTINKFNSYSKKLTLPNFENWVLRGALLQYCESHLEDIHSVEEAQKALDVYHEKGRKADEKIDSIIYGTYTMFKDATNDTRATSTGLCRIITNYLFYLDMITKYEVENEQLIAGRIKYLLKQDKRPQFRPYSHSGKEGLKLWSKSGRNTFEDMIK